MQVSLTKTIKSLLDWRQYSDNISTQIYRFCTNRIRFSTEGLSRSRGAMSPTSSFTLSQRYAPATRHLPMETLFFTPLTFIICLFVQGHSLRHNARIAMENDVHAKYKADTAKGFGGHENDNSGLPPYIIPGTPEEANWRRSHPSGNVRVFCGVFFVSLADLKAQATHR